MTPQQKRFERLVPFYVNGTLEGDDLAFMQDYLAHHPNAERALALTKHIQQTVQTLVQEQPQAATVDRFLNKWAQTQTDPQNVRLPKAATHAATHTSSAMDELSGWWIGLAGLGVATMAATLMLMPGFAPLGALHLDGLDGRPDLEVVLAQNISPDHETVIAHLKRFNGQIVAQSEQDGYHRISIDLQNRAADQHELIAVLQSDGHLQSYTLLASR
ncbi:MAG: hypothetical protein LRY61_11635 [Burkholderiaceae bacterium]|nr:hypothetical protein [Burkholderiaceae bacterium]MCD8517889.1 hypothetical protein [Burkholderiaceae bacterium]